MKSFVKYISKYLAVFMAFAVFLILLNVIAFGWTFHSTMTQDYGAVSPQRMLEEVAAASNISGTTAKVKSLLESNQIWALFLDAEGHAAWSVNAPDEVQTVYTIQEVAVFSKGYINDYPVFVWADDDGLLVLGYPKNSFTKITSNYVPLQAVKMLPFFLIGMLALDLLLIFLAYYSSKRKITKSIEPIAASIESLADGKPVSLAVRGELSEIAASVEKASGILSRQNIARANWISGVSHDIRTPLSMILGYAVRIAEDESASATVAEQAKIIQRQSIKIKELVQDLNLVSQLEYEMQPMEKAPAQLSKLLRSTIAELLNVGIPGEYSFAVEISPAAESVTINCNARLISRAISNLVQNSINHNPQGCHIQLSLDCSALTISLCVSDDGIGLSPDKLKELKEKPHYMNSTDERLDLRHGLGLILVRQIAEAHGGSLEIKNGTNSGMVSIIVFPKVQ